MTTAAKRGTCAMTDGSGPRDVSRGSRHDGIGRADAAGLPHCDGWGVLRAQAGGARPNGAQGRHPRGAEEADDCKGMPTTNGSSRSIACDAHASSGSTCSDHSSTATEDSAPPLKGASGLMAPAGTDSTRSEKEPFACTDEVGEGWIARAARARTTSEIACRMNVTAGCSTATLTPCDQGVKTLVGTSWPRGMSDEACPRSTQPGLGA